MADSQRTIARWVAGDIQKKPRSLREPGARPRQAKAVAPRNSAPTGMAALRMTTIDQVGREIFELMLAVASGQRTCAERLGHREFVPWRIGPVM